MEYSSKQSQEKRRGFIDPRTKLALILILALFVTPLIKWRIYRL